MDQHTGELILAALRRERDAIETAIADIANLMAADGLAPQVQRGRARKGPHWTQTPEGAAQHSERMKRAWKTRKQQAAAATKKRAPAAE